MTLLKPAFSYLFLTISFFFFFPNRIMAQSDSQANIQSPRQKVIIDTDIGDDIDDAFAVGLALQSDELNILGVTSAWGNTPLRARLLRRLLDETGRSDIPVAVGIEKYLPGKHGTLSQARYAEQETADRSYSNAVDFLLEQLRLHPGEITLIGIGPLTNIGAAIERDLSTFRKLKRVVIMGGSVHRGYNRSNYPFISDQPDREYNIASDIPAAQKLFGAGVPLYVMPLDSTQIKLEEINRAQILRRGTRLTDALTLLYNEWAGGWQQIPTLFDVVAVAYAVNPNLCPTKPLRLRVDENGYTKEEPGAPNTEVCLSSNSDQFLAFFMPRILR